MKKLMTAAIGISLLACTMAHAMELKRVDEAKAKSLFTEYLKGSGRPTEEYAFNLKPFGNSTWLINCYTKHFSPALPWRHVMNSRGEIKEMTMDSLNVVFLNEYPSSPKEKDRDNLIQDFVKLHAGEPVSVINKTSDIPGYDKAPLDPDIAQAVRAPFSYDNLIAVVYTYQQIGGIVRRYRFQFENGTTFKRVECAVLGKDIGEAQYYE